MRLFLYGTLRPDAGTPMGEWVAQRLLRSESGHVPGRLHAIPDAGGWYPALTPGQGRVRGLLCELVLKPGDLALIDRYEGREYRRTALRVSSACGLLGARGYVWRGRLPARSVTIRGGDFTGWLRTARARSFQGACHRGDLSLKARPSIDTVES